MKELLQLIRAVNANNLTVNRKKKNGKIRKNKVFSLSLFLSGLILLSVSVTNFTSTFFTLKSLGFSAADYRDYISFFLSCVFFYGLFMSLCLSISIFFKGKDEIFLPLPISGHKIFLAKMLLSSSYNFYYGGMTLLTCSFLVCILMGFNAISYFYSFLFFLFFMLFSPCLSFLILSLLSKFINLKSSKKFVSILTILFGILGALSLFPINSTSSLFPNAENLTKADAINVLATFLNKFRFISFFLNGEVNAIYHTRSADHLYVLIYFLITALALALTFFITKSSYIKTLGNKVTRIKKAENPSKSKRKEIQSYKRISHPFFMKVHLEFSNYVHEGTLFFFSLITSILFYLTLINTMISLKKDTNIPFEIYTGMVLIFQCFSMDFSTLPYIALSINKENLVLLKTFPIKKNGDFFAKLVPSFALYLPLYLIYTTISLSVVASMETILPFVLISFAFALSVIFSSNYLGNRFPNFNYGNVFEILKKGIGAILSRFLSTIFCIPLTVFVIGFPMLGINRLLSYLIAFIFFGILAILFLVFSRKRLNQFYKSDYTR